MSNSARLSSTRAMRNRRTRWATALLAVVTAVLAGCTASGNHGAGGSTVRVNAIASGPFTRQFNPLLISSQTSNGYAVLNIYEQLLAENYARSALQPWLAASYGWSKDGKSLTIHVQPNVEWSNGTPLTAKDVAYTFELLRKHAEFNSNGLPLAGATATSPDVAVVHFTEPAFQVLWWRTSIVPEQIWTKIPDPVTYTNPDPVGSGAYTLSSFSPQVITLKKNPHYWQPGKPKLSQVQYLSYDSDSSAVAALQAGEVDWISPNISNPKTLADRSSQISYWVTAQNTGIIFLVPNAAVHPTSDPAVRQAISAALDRNVISKVGLGGLNPPAVSPVGLDPLSAGQRKLIAPEYQSLRYGPANPAKAKSILVGAGYKLGSNGYFTTPEGKSLKLSLMVATSSGFGDMVSAAQLIVKQLAAAGIKLTVKTESSSAWRNDINVGQYQLSMRSIGGTLNFYDRYDSILDQAALVPNGKKALANYERYQNPEATTLLKQYQNSAAGSRGEAAALAGLQRIMVTDMPVIPLYMNDGIGMWRTDRFTGWPSTKNPYAVSIGNQPDASWVLKNLTPTTGQSGS